jgi:aryl-alcohol dehydrogenase-like predicted oxidoreductase
VEAIVNTALDRGGNLFDTAEMYNEGASEKALGQALKRRRAEAIIVSKITPDHCRKDLLRTHCEASLRRLQTDYLDIYMVHWPITLRPAGGAISGPTAEGFQALMQLQAEGKIRFIGVSNFGVRQLTEALATGAEIAVNELAYSLLARAIESELLPFCRGRGIGVIGYMALMQGLLSDKFTSFAELPPNRLRTRHFASSRPGTRHGEAGCEQETAAALEGIRAIARSGGMPVSRLALAWAMANPGVACVLAGTRNLQQLADNLAAAQVELAPGVLAQLNASTRPLLEKMGPNADLWENAANSRIA